MKHPFVHGRTVKQDEFIGRQNELRAILSRIENGESTAVVGDPHIGKTSLLKYIACPEVLSANLDDPGRFTLSFIDLLSIPSSYTPRDFWIAALEPLATGTLSTTVKARLQDVVTQNFSQRSLEKLFRLLDTEKRTLVLLLDEFDRLLVHPNFADPSFFAHLRSITTHMGGLQVVTASRKTVAEMNDMGKGLLDTGSPFFNHFSQEILKPFDVSDAKLLFLRAGDRLSTADQKFVLRVAGRHPFLLQAMAATLLETQGENRYIRASEKFYERISAHFDDLWAALDDRTRTTAIILSLVELGGEALGQDYSFGEIERVKSFAPELKNLAVKGLAKVVKEGSQFDSEHLLFWQGQRWGIEPKSFIWWIQDVVIAEARRFPGYEEWLKNKRYTILLTQEQWDSLSGLAKNAPNWAIKGVTDMALILLKQTGLG